MLLSILIFLPMLFALVVLILPTAQVRWASLFMSLIHFVASLYLLKIFQVDLASLQLVERYSWLPSIGVSYFVGVDGISLWLVLLTTFLAPLTILGSWTSVTEKIKGFHICLFL